MKIRSKLIRFNLLFLCLSSLSSFLSSYCQFLSKFLDSTLSLQPQGLTLLLSSYAVKLDFHNLTDLSLRATRLFNSITLVCQVTKHNLLPYPLFFLYCSYITNNIYPTPPFFINRNLTT